MDTIFDYIVDAAYKIEEFTEDDLVGATVIEEKFTSFTVIHDLKSATITNNHGADFNKGMFQKIFLLMLNEKKRLLDIEAVENRRLEQERINKKFQLISHAGSMAGY